MELEQKIKNFDGIMGHIFGICDNIIKSFVMGGEILTINIKENGLDLTENLNVIIDQYNKFKKGYAITNDINKKNEHYLGLFDKIFKEGNGILFQAMDNDSWIRKSSLKLMYGDTVGKTSTIVLHISDIYKMSLSVKSNREKNIKEYPDLFKVDDTIKYPAYILYDCFKLFRLTDSMKDEEKLKTVNLIIGKLENKLGIGNNGPNALLQNMDPILSIGADMLNKYNGDKGGPNIGTDNLKNIFNKVLGGNSIQNLMNDIKEAASSSNGNPPDIGTIFGSVMKNLNPEEMINTLKSAVDTELPSVANKDTKVEEKEEIVEEIIEESDDEGNETDGIVENNAEEIVESEEEIIEE